MNDNELTRKGPHVPTEGRALRRLEHHVQIGDIGDLTLLVPVRPRYLVTYMNSQTGGRHRSATVVSVTNQADKPNEVTVTWFKGFTDDASPVGSSTFIIPPDFTVDFGSRSLPGELTVVNSTPNPQLTFDEGRAIVSSRRAEIGVSARVYYTAGDGDEELNAITDSKVVRYGKGNHGD